MHPIRQILIVGGGSSGWMTASLLKRQLPHIDICLIEASDIAILGVGESTNPVINYFHRLVGIDEASFMRAANAAFKIAIRFENFSTRGGVFFHPFGQPKNIDHALFRNHAERQHVSYRLATSGNLISRSCSYAYQVDAGLYAQFLRNWSKARGVRHIVDRVQSVKIDDRQRIVGIDTDRHGCLTADLYIDCSGFRSHLLSGAIHEPFMPCTRFLANDRAVATRVPYENKLEELATYTNCVAMSAGWIWSIPLWSRLGTGYVYSSTFRSASDAEAELRAYLGADRVKNCEFNHIDIRVGRHERAWVQNCVALGPSYGFLEPLESTGLSLTQIALIDLSRVIKSGATSVMRERFNRRQASIFDTTRDFIVAHYVLTRRDDTPYWQHIRYDNAIPDSLADLLEQIERKRTYAAIERLTHTFYDVLNWNLILSGMGLFEAGDEAPDDVMLPPANPHWSVLRNEVHDGEHSDETLTAATIADGAHPVWAPTW